MKRRCRIKLVFTGEDSVPLLTFLLNDASFDLALHFTVQLDLDRPDFGEVQPLAMQDLKSTLWIGERVIAIPTFKARIAGLFPFITRRKKAWKALSSRFNTS